MRRTAPAVAVEHAEADDEIGARVRVVVEVDDPAALNGSSGRLDRLVYSAGLAAYREARSKADVDPWPIRQVKQNAAARASVTDPGGQP